MRVSLPAASGREVVSKVEAWSRCWRENGHIFNKLDETLAKILDLGYFLAALETGWCERKVSKYSASLSEGARDRTRYFLARQLQLLVTRSFRSMSRTEVNV